MLITAFHKQVVRTSDFLLYDDSLSAPSSSPRYPSIAYTPSTGLWSSVPPSLTTDDSSSTPAVELWLKQLVVEVPTTLPVAQTLQMKEIISSGTAAALSAPEVECYKAPGSSDCWDVQTQPTLNRTARSFAFTSPTSAKAFSAAFHSLPSLRSSSLELKALPKRRRGTRNYASFFSRARGEDEASSRSGEEEDAAEWEVERSMEDMKSVKWMLYAVRAFVMRFYGLAKVGS